MSDIFECIMNTNSLGLAHVIIFDKNLIYFGNDPNKMSTENIEKTNFKPFVPLK